MPPITGNPSLLAPSHFRLPNSVPHGSPADAPLNRNVGGKSGFPRSHSCRPQRLRAYPFSTGLSPDDASTTCTQFKGVQPAIHRFWSDPVKLWLFETAGVHSTVHVRCASGTCLAPHLTAAGSVDSFPVTRVNRCNRGHAVPRASNPTVTSRARPGRQLLVVQQVTASIYDLQVVESDKAEKSFAFHYIADLRPAEGGTRRT